MMKIALLIACVCMAYAAAAPQKRIIASDLAQEAGKILKCEGEKHEEGCMLCCENTTWYFSSEKTACNVACKILPNKDDYITVTKFPYSTYTPYVGGGSA